MKHFTGLWRHRDFMKLWAAQTVSQLGSQIGGGALRFTAILALGATPVQLGLLSAAQVLPALLLGLLAGVWVDRARRRPLLIAADLGRGLLLLSVPLAALAGALRIEQLYLVAAAVGALSIVFEVAYQSYLPALVRREQLVEGNSKLGVSDSLAEIAGPPAGGALVQTVGGPLSVALDALSFFGSALALWRIRTPEPTPEPAEERQPVLPEVYAGLRATVADPLLRTLLGVALTQGFFGPIIGVLYDLYLLRELGLSPALIGVTVAVGGVSALGGALLAQRVTTRLGVGRTMALALLAGALATPLLPLAAGPLAFWIIVLAQATDITDAIYMINERSLRQALVPAHLQGRVAACFQVLTTAVGLAGVLLAGLLAELVGLRAAIGVACLGLVAARLWLIGSPLLRVQTLPEAQEEIDGEIPDKASTTRLQV
ncbi:MAG TPA: MFS transporter [Roseiflexaceae bacterium]|nr:MFS transporter [Roseiflexaceae bacterium]